MFSRAFRRRTSRAWTLRTAGASLAFVFATTTFASDIVDVEAMEPQTHELEVPWSIEDGIDSDSSDISIDSNGNGTFDIFASDGTYESGYKLRSATPEFAVALQTGEGRVFGTRVCLNNLGGRISSFRVGYAIYTDSNGRPGTLRKFDVSTASLPAGRACANLSFDRSLSVGTETYWVSTYWDSRSFPNVYVLADENGSTAHASRVRNLDPQSGWSKTEHLFSRYRGLGIAVIFDPATTPCRESTGVICLDRGRFEVVVAWRDPSDGDRLKFVNLIRYSDTSALGYFKNPSNVELLLKTVNGCRLNDHKWVFVGGVTNQNVIVLVTDTVTGQFRLYENNRGQSFRTVADTGALPVC